MAPTKSPAQALTITPTSNPTQSPTSHPILPAFIISEDNISTCAAGGSNIVTSMGECEAAFNYLHISELGSCGCEEDGVLFCNYDSPGEGCEPCSNFADVAACYTDNLPGDGADDCAARCFGQGPPGTPEYAGWTFIAGIQGDSDVPAGCVLDRTSNTVFLNNPIGASVPDCDEVFAVSCICAYPTQSPTVAPTKSPTLSPTLAPTEVPTKSPTFGPTLAPTEAPTQGPTQAPTEAPSATPTANPTKAPTEVPTESATGLPTQALTSSPTTNPPSIFPTTSQPTAPPTEAPTETPYYVVEYTYELITGAGFEIARRGVGSVTSVGKSVEAMITASTDIRFKKVESQLNEIAASFRVYDKVSL